MELVRGQTNDDSVGFLDADARELLLQRVIYEQQRPQLALPQQRARNASGRDDVLGPNVSQPNRVQLGDLL